MMLFAIVFGLSMDYEVFLLSRMREEYDRTGDNATAVADGLAATARVITAAAAIMVFVFGSFLLEIARPIKLFGLGLALARQVAPAPQRGRSRRHRSRPRARRSRRGRSDAADLTIPPGAITGR